MRKCKPCHDPDGPRKLSAAFHGADRVAHNDKYLAAANKPRPACRTYKSPLFNQEPELLPMELTTGARERRLDKIFMQRQTKTIAVIDDDIGIRQALQRMLSISGFRVHAFASGEEFLAALATCDAGCAVMDVDLGTVCGLDLARHPLVVAAKLPLIFISGTCDETVRDRALALGCSQYLSKPFTPAELLDAILRATQELPIP